MNEIILYQTENNQTQVEVQFDGETVWLNQKQMSHLFEKDVDTISLHLKNIYAEKELDEKSTSGFFSLVQKEGNRRVNRKIRFYNLDAIISVGYRVSSKRGTQFRQWATQRLKDFLVKGYAINRKRLNALQQALQLIQKPISLSQYFTV